MKRYIISIIAAFAVMMGITTFTATAANASDTTTPPTSGSTITSESSSSSTDEARVTSAGSIDATANAKTLAYIKASGMAKSDHKYSKPKSITLGKSASYYTSYKNYAGKEVWHWKKYSKGKKFYLGRDGWYHDPNCYNKIAIKGKKKPKSAIVVSGSVKIVKSFTYVAKASATVTATAKATAKAWCRNEWTSAEATAEAYSSASAEASASASGYTKVSAEASAKGSAKSLALSASFQSSIKLRVLADAQAKATADASAKVTCASGPTTPPATPKPVLFEISTINDVLINNTRTNSVSGTVAPGYTGNLFCTARNGGTITAGKQQQVSGNFSAQHTYMAPSEVPAANSEFNIAAGRDRVDCTLTQNDGQSVSISTNQFEIRPAPVDPM